MTHNLEGPVVMETEASRLSVQAKEVRGRGSGLIFEGSDTMET